MNLPHETNAFNDPPPPRIMGIAFRPPIGNIHWAESCGGRNCTFKRGERGELTWKLEYNDSTVVEQIGNKFGFENKVWRIQWLEKRSWADEIR